MQYGVELRCVLYSSSLGSSLSAYSNQQAVGSPSALQPEISAKELRRTSCDINTQVKCPRRQFLSKTACFVVLDDAP